MDPSLELIGPAGGHPVGENAAGAPGSSDGEIFCGGTSLKLAWRTESLDNTTRKISAGFKTFLGLMDYLFNPSPAFQLETHGWADKEAVGGLQV